MSLHCHSHARRVGWYNNGMVSGHQGVTSLAQLLPQEGGKLSSSEVVVHNHRGKRFCAQPTLQPCDACCRVTARSKTVLRCFYVFLHAAEDTQSYKLH